jgi:hypothetical protein
MMSSRESDFDGLGRHNKVSLEETLNVVIVNRVASKCS